MNEKILGYLVLRKPLNSFDELGRGAFLSSAMEINGLYYGGIDRMQWFDIDEDFYTKKLPDNLIDIRKDIWNSPFSGCDYKLCNCLENAKSLLQYSNSESKKNELVAVYVDEPSYDEMSFESEFIDSFLGCDIYCNGYGSLIKEGIFSQPLVFSEFVKKLNKNGIFDLCDKTIGEYISFYDKIASQESIEKTYGEIRKAYLYKVSI